MRKALKYIKKIINNKFVLFGAIVVQLVLLYGLTYWGYHTSRLPYWFDNFVDKTGIWRIYGKKTYGENVYSKDLWLDPRLDMVEEVIVSQEYLGYLNKIKDNALFIASDGPKEIDIAIANDVIVIKNDKDVGWESLDVGDLVLVVNEYELDKRSGETKLYFTQIKIQ